MHQRSAFRWTRKNNLSAHQLRTLAHRDQANAPPVWALGEANSMIFHFQLQRIGKKRNRTHACLAPECRATLFSASCRTR